MARSNRTNRRPQRIKHHIEDAVARRALHREVDQSYREEARIVTHEHGHITIVTFTDASFGAAC